MSLKIARNHKWTRAGHLVGASCLSIFALAALSASAEAACTIVGNGTQTSLDTGDVITCLGAGNTAVATNSNESNITINIGNGATATSVMGDPPVAINNSTNSTIHIFNQATIQSTNWGIRLNSSDFNTVTVDQGTTLATSAAGSKAIEVFLSNSNTITVGGTLGDLSANAYAILTSSSSTGNNIAILSTGLLQSSTQSAIRFGAGGNTINNSGTISSSSSYAIQGSSGVDVVTIREPSRATPRAPLSCSREAQTFSSCTPDRS